MGGTAAIFDPNALVVNGVSGGERAQKHPARTGGGAVQAGAEHSRWRGVGQPCGSQRKKRTASTALATSHPTITTRLVVMLKYEPASSSVLRSASPR